MVSDRFRLVFLSVFVVFAIFGVVGCTIDDDTDAEIVSDVTDDDNVSDVEYVEDVIEEDLIGDDDVVEIGDLI